MADPAGVLIHFYASAAEGFSVTATTCWHEAEVDRLADLVGSGTRTASSDPLRRRMSRPAQHPVGGPNGGSPQEPAVSHQASSGRWLR